MIQIVLDEISDKQGWDSESEIIHLCGFIETFQGLTVAEIGAKFGHTISMINLFRMYLEEIAEEENSWPVGDILDEIKTPKKDG